MANKTKTTVIGVGIFVFFIALMLFGGGPPVWKYRANNSTPREVKLHPIEHEGKGYLLSQRTLRYGGGKGSSGKPWDNYRILDPSSGQTVGKVYFPPGLTLSFKNTEYIGQHHSDLVFETKGKKSDGKGIHLFSTPDGKPTGNGTSILQAFRQRQDTPAGDILTFSYDGTKGCFDLKLTSGHNHCIDKDGRAGGGAARRKYHTQRVALQYSDLQSSYGNLQIGTRSYSLQNREGTEFRRLRLSDEKGMKEISEMDFLKGRLLFTANNCLYILHLTELGEKSRLLVSAYDIGKGEVIWQLNQKNIVSQDLPFNKFYKKNINLELLYDNDLRYFYLNSRFLLHKVDALTGQVVWTHGH